MKRWRWLLGMVALAGALGGPARADEASEQLERGRAILSDKCSGCHAVGQDGASPLGQAPPFRTLPKRYPVADLAEALAEGIVTGHPDMPQFVFPPADIDAIIGYLQSLTPADR